jgi:hypothetical protein
MTHSQKDIQMTRCMSRSVLAVLALSLACWSAVPSSKAADNAAPAAKQKAKPRGRLPAYYSDVIDGEQRTKIYAIQDKYDPQFEALRAQMKALGEQQEKGVLSGICG